MTQLYRAYAISEAFLFIFTLNIWRKLGTSLGSKSETRELRHAIYTYLITLATDIIWACAEDNVIEFSWAALVAINGVYLCAFTSVCFFWYRFTAVRLNTRFSFSIPRALLNLPYALTIGCIVLSAFTGWIYYIDNDGTYVHGGLYALFLFGCFFYAGLAFVRSIAAFMGAKTAAKRRECLVCAAYVIPPTIGQILKPLLPTVPLLHSSMFLILQILFLTLQENQIYNDALTGLNNRRRLNYYLEEQLPTASDKKPITVYMMDVDNFKSINDTFGHVEGDRALIAIGQTLKRVAGEFNCFVARYGGDEFCMVSIGGQNRQEEIKARIRELLTQTQRQATDLAGGYVLSMSIGCAVCSEPQHDMDKIIRQADEKLHEAKQASKERKSDRTGWGALGASRGPEPVRNAEISRNARTTGLE